LPSAAQSTAPVRLRDGKRRRRTGRHARRPGGGRGKLPTRRNAKRTISASRNSTVQFDDEAASVVFTVEVATARSRTARRPAASQWRGIWGASRCAYACPPREGRGSSCASMRCWLFRFNFLDRRTKLEGNSSVGLVKVKHRTVSRRGS
jgi:hypothetical protein